MPKLNKPIYLYVLMSVVVLGLVLMSSINDRDSEQSPQAKKPSDSSTTQQLEHSLDDPTSLLAVVNKQRPIDIEYSPKLSVPDVPLTMDSATENMKLSSVIKSPIENMFSKASKQGIKYRLGSGYRSAFTQESLYNAYVTEQGRTQADKYSARPGHSEHQTGLAADIVSSDNHCYMEECWADTKEGRWLKNNAHKYGFIIRYLKGKEAITGYNYEPWHVRYVGIEVAKNIWQSGNTLEEYFGLKPAPDYLSSN